MILNEKVVVVTGASKGLGVAMAEECAMAGASVVLAARDEARLEQVRDDIRQKGGTASAVRCDVAQFDDLERLVAHAVETYGAIHGLINNAGANFVNVQRLVP